MTAEIGWERKLVSGGKNGHTARTIAVNNDLDVPQPANARLRRGTVGTHVRESSRVKRCESAVRRTSKRERCVKELVNNNHTLERPSKVKKNSHIHHRCFLCSVDVGL